MDSGRKVGDIQIYHSLSPHWWKIRATILHHQFPKVIPMFPFMNTGPHGIQWQFHSFTHWPPAISQPLATSFIYFLGLSILSSEGFWHSTIYKRECLIIFHLFSNIFYNSILKHRMPSENKPRLYTWTQAYSFVDCYVLYWICHIRHFPDIQWF